MGGELYRRFEPCIRRGRLHALDRRVDFAKQSRCVKHLLDRQMPDGGWNIYYKGPSELNATLKAYFALKLAGFLPDDPRMIKAHATIVRLGGIPKANTYTKLFLALFGAVSVEVSSDHSAGDHPAAELALF